MQLNLNPLMQPLDKMNIEPVYHVNLVYVKSKVPSFVLEELKQEAKTYLRVQINLRKSMMILGNLEQEYQTSKGREILQPYLISLADEYFKCSEKHKQSQGCPHSHIGDIWMNFQKKYEYNPIHNHTGKLSFVLWVQIPYDLEDELSLPNCVNSNTPSNSLFQFTYTNLYGDVVSNQLNIDKSWEGSIIMFPSYLNHMVYPFYTSDEYRISMSGNIFKEQHLTKDISSSYEYR